MIIFFMRVQVSEICFHSQFEMGAVLSAAMSVTEGHVQDFTASLFKISCIIWSRNPEAWPSLPGLKMGVRERLQNKKTLCCTFDWWHQTEWVQKQCQYESSELIEVQRAELMMNSDKPEREMLIGLEYQCVICCVLFLLLECQGCCLGLSVLVRKVVHHGQLPFFPLNVAEGAGIIPLVHVYMGESPSARTNWQWSQHCQWDLQGFWSLVQKSCMPGKSLDVLHIHYPLSRSRTAAVTAILFWAPFTWWV